MPDYSQPNPQAVVLDDPFRCQSRYDFAEHRTTQEPEPGYAIVQGARCVHSRNHPGTHRAFTGHRWTTQTITVAPSSCTSTYDGHVCATQQWPRTGGFTPGAACTMEQDHDGPHRAESGHAWYETGGSRNRPAT